MGLRKWCSTIFSGANVRKDPSNASTLSNTDSEIVSVPWYTPPPVIEGKDEKKPEGIDGRKGVLGEMGKIRKREEDDAEADEPSTDPKNGAPDENSVRPTKRRKKG